MHYICNSIETKILIITYYKYLLINKPKKKPSENEQENGKTFNDENQDAVSRDM